MTEQEDRELLERAARGDAEAQGELLAVHRDRLRRMIETRLGPRLRVRADASDIVQEALAEACQQLPEYLKDPPIPLYPWLRQFAWNRMVDLHRRHVRAQKASVLREQAPAPALADDSVRALADLLAASQTTPSGRLNREEQRARVQTALEQLAEPDREVLALRYLEKLSMAEIAAVLGVKEGAVKVRHFRALERLRKALGPMEDEE